MTQPNVSDGCAMGELLPRGIATAESSAFVSEEALHPSELALIDRALPRRRLEFATARHCARRALVDLAMAPAPILRGANREPLWPGDIVGSITHCSGYHAAAVGRTANFRSIGIDAEPDEPLPEGVLDQICLPAERAQLYGIDGPHLDRVLFSAKESLFKAWFPLTDRWLDFHDALIRLRADGTFGVEIGVPGPIAAAQGRWLGRDGLVLTALALPAADAA